MERTVSSGYSVHWFRADLPTIQRPSGDNATTEGMMRSLATGRMAGLPSRTTLTAEKVVPRSMPTILMLPLSSLVIHHDIRIAQHFAAMQIPAAFFRDNDAIVCAGIADALDGDVFVR